MASGGDHRGRFHLLRIVFSNGLRSAALHFCLVVSRDFSGGRRALLHVPGPSFPVKKKKKQRSPGWTQAIIGDTAGFPITVDRVGRGE